MAEPMTHVPVEHLESALGIGDPRTQADVEAGRRERAAQLRVDARATSSGVKTTCWC